MRCLEAAETLEDPAARAEWPTVVFVGAGYAGLEGLAELQDFAADLIDLYPRCRIQGMRWILAEAKERVMTEIEPSLAEFGTRELRSRGIEIKTSTTLEEVTPRSATLSGGERIPTHTVVWTAGVKPHPVVAELGLKTDRGGRIVTGRTLRVAGRDDVWAIGDAAAVPDPATKFRASCPPTAQHAIRQGRLVAGNVAATIATGTVKPFTYKTKGVFVDLGQAEAVASTMGLKLARAPRVVPGPHLPPGDDAGHEAQAAPADRLERPAALRPGRLRARPPRSPATARGGVGRRYVRRGYRRRRPQLNSRERAGVNSGATDTPP